MLMKIIHADSAYGYWSYSGIKVFVGDLIIVLGPARARESTMASMTSCGRIMLWDKILVRRVLAPIG